MPFAFSTRLAPLSLLKLEGRISPADLSDLKAYYLANAGTAVQHDALYLVPAGADFSAIAPGMLHAFRAELIEAFLPVTRHVVARTAFVCGEPKARPALEAWRDLARPDDGMASEVGVFDTLDQAAAWLALSPAEGAKAATFFAPEPALAPSPAARTA